MVSSLYIKLGYVVMLLQLLLLLLLFFYYYYYYSTVICNLTCDIHGNRTKEGCKCACDGNWVGLTCGKNNVFIIHYFLQMAITIQDIPRQHTA